MTRATVRVFAAVFFAAFAVLSAKAAFAGVQEDVERVFALNAKIKPGLPLERLNELLGPAAQTSSMGEGMEDVTRYMWLHGEMGVEAYCIQEVAHKVNITLPLRSENDVRYALDAFTRQGRSVYGSMPRFDQMTGEYYWIGTDSRFGFSKYNSTTVRSSSTWRQ